METLTVKTEMKGNVAVVTVSGRIDSESAPALDAELTKITGGTSKLVVDFKGVEYMSSAGLRAVIKASQAAERSGGSIKLASVPEEITSVVYTVGLNQKLGSFASVEEAMASF
ncbi:MAG: anti-sigma factor antagonist [Chloroflexi bacterium]|nr:MAG: anti-sigma factor antagonist [Chloroflexota bacterium]